MRIALTGNPNSGKTTMYNALTGRNEKVGNWAGVTVEKKEHLIKKSYISTNIDIVAVDLPGAYSMSPFTSEEGITSSYVKNENPDVIINIVDSTNLSRSLFFTTQLLELGIPVIVALNKSDINKKKKTVIDTEALSKRLGCPVLETISTSAEGLKALVDAAIEHSVVVQKAPSFQGKFDYTSKKAAEMADRARFDFVNKIVKEVQRRSVNTEDKNLGDKIDVLLINKWIGIPIFAIVMWAVFWISQAGPGVWIADWLVGILENGQGWISTLFKDANPLLSALLVDGVIGGVIAVIGFLPLVMVMYFLIALLEDCGYMSRVSVILDPIFKKVGLSGKSVISFVIGTGCAIPGVMASRTIRDERERRATAMLAPFMPCGAKLPVIALFAGAFFRGASWVGPIMYFLGILIIFLCAMLVNRITAVRAKKSYFIMELPDYKLPSLKRAFLSMCQRGWAFVVKAATVILVCNTVVQIMQSFTWTMTVAQDASSSILASLARPFAYLLIPVIGFNSWQFAAASVTGFIAKENVVATLATSFALSDITSGISAAAPDLTAVAALSYLMFNLFTPPCFAAIGAMNSEMKSAKWLWGAIALQFGVGYSIGYVVYQIGTLITTGAFGAGFVPGLIVLVIIIAIAVYMISKSDKKLKSEYALNL